mgnify:FL=1
MAALVFDPGYPAIKHEIKMLFCSIISYKKLKKKLKGIYLTGKKLVII